MRARQTASTLQCVVLSDMCALKSSCSQNLCITEEHFGRDLASGVEAKPLKDVWEQLKANPKLDPP